MAEEAGGLVVAAYAFEAENDDELGVEEGARIRTLERREEWWLAETEDGKRRGIIPVTYVVSEEEYARMIQEDDDDEEDDEVDEEDEGEDGKEHVQNEDEEQGNANEVNVQQQQQQQQQEEDGDDDDDEDVEYEVDVDEVDLADIPEAFGRSDAEEKPPPPMPEEAEAAWKQMQSAEEAASRQEASQTPTAGAMATGPDPEVAAQTPPVVKAEVPDVSYDDLAQKFEALQRRVQGVRLSEAPPEGDDATAGDAAKDAAADAAAAAAAAADEATMPPALNLDMYRQASASSPASGSPSSQSSGKSPHSSSPSPPPSPKEAAAAASLQKQLQMRTQQQQQQQQSRQSSPPSPSSSSPPPPPSPVVAKKALDQEQIARQRRASAEEESLRRAEQIRAEREEAQRRQHAVAEEDREGREHIRRMGQSQASRATDFKAHAVEAAKNAVAADQAKDFAKAYHLYVDALEAFCKMLETTPHRPGIRDNRGVVCERMQSYLSRMSALEPFLCAGAWSDGKDYGFPPVDRYRDRVRIILQMARTSQFNPGTIGDELRMRARFAEAKEDLRGAFRAYNEGLEYYMACHKLLKETGKPDDPALVMHISNMLTAAERLKQKL